MALEPKRETRQVPVGGEIRMRHAETEAPAEREEIEVPSPAIESEAAPEPVVEPVRSVSPEPRVQRPAIVEKDFFTREIEAVLSDELADLYRQMPPEKQKPFRERGETLAEEIRKMLPQAKSGKIFDLVKAWMKMIPDVNTFFLEQEAHIKTNKLLLLADTERLERANKVA